MSRKSEEDSVTRILKPFLTHVEFKQSDMKKETKLAYPTIVKHVHCLIKEGLISFREERSQKGGKDKRILSLTSEGLFFVLGQIRLTDIELVMVKYQDKALLFKKWYLFKQAKIDECLLRILTMAINNFNNGRLHPFVEYMKPVEKDQEASLLVLDWDSIDAFILMKVLTLHVSESEILLNICKHDPELNTFLDKCLKMEMVKKEAAFKELQSFKVEWDKLS